MRQYRSSGSVEGVMGNHDSYSDSPLGSGVLLGRPILRPAWSRRYLLKFEFQHAVGHAQILR